MPARQYYSARTGRTPGSRLDLPALRKLFLPIYFSILEKEHLQEMLGKDCPDERDSYGTAGRDVGAYVLRRVRKDHIWPIPDQIESYSEDDVFDVIEFLYDHVSQGVSGWHHNFGGCGMHYDTFNREPARVAYRAEVNDLLADYSTGFTLSEAGEIEHLPEAGFANLVVAGLPSSDPTNVDARVKAAVSKYLRRASSLDDRRDAVRGLADVLEYLRPKLKTVLNSKDEGALFDIANNFAVRHHNERQRSNYDPNVWTSWMFYFYLATVHAAQRMIQRAEGARSSRAG